MVDPAVRWRLEGARALLTCGPLEAVASCDDRGHDLVVTSWNGKPVSDVAVLGSAGPKEASGSIAISERYLRGADFVAIGIPSGKFRIATQVYWRAMVDQTRLVASVELMLSAQTELLDSVPTWTVTSFLGAAKRFYACGLDRSRFEDISGAAKSIDAGECKEHLLLFRIESLGMSYAQMVHPSDFVSAHAAFFGDKPFGVEATLFPEHLEKGVIRRGRIRGWFMPVENDQEMAVELARAFVNEQLPLTT